MNVIMLLIACCMLAFAFGVAFGLLVQIYVRHQENKEYEIKDISKRRR